MKPVVLLLADEAFAADIAASLMRAGHAVQIFESVDDLLASADHETAACLVNDVAHLEGTPADLIQTLERRDVGHWPVILLSEKTTVRAAVELMRTGIHDLLEKPVSPEKLLTSLASADLKLSLRRGGPGANRPSQRVLTPRERQVAEHLASGLTTREVADALAISARTVDVHRGKIFTKLGVANVAALAMRLAGRER